MKLTFKKLKAKISKLVNHKFQKNQFKNKKNFLNLRRQWKRNKRIKKRRKE